MNSNKKSRQCNVRMPLKLLEKIEEARDKTTYNYSEFIKFLIKLGLEDFDKKGESK